MLTVAVIGTRGFPGVQGGVEIHSENLYSRMSDDIAVRLYRRKPYLSEQSKLRYKNIGYVDLPSTKIKGLEAVLHTFLAVIHILFHRPDIVHIHNIGPGLFTPLLRLFGLKVVLTYHSPNYEHKKWGWMARQILKFGEYLSLNFANMIIFVNKAQMLKYSQKILVKSLNIVNGITHKERSDNQDYINKIGLEKSGYLLSVGRLTPEKGFEYLVEAANRIDEIKHVVIAGASDHDDSYCRKLKSLDKSNKVIFTGFTFGENLRQLYSNAQLYVLSSVNEGFPLVLLEAMDYCLPIVASNIPATNIPQLSDDDFFEVGNTDSLVEVLKRKLSNSRCGEPRHYDLSAYNWDNIASQTIAVYKSIR